MPVRAVPGDDAAAAAGWVTAGMASSGVTASRLNVRRPKFFMTKCLPHVRVVRKVGAAAAAQRPHTAVPSSQHERPVHRHEHGRLIVRVDASGYLI
ncbi:hypothetical protein GCM10009548_52680 [Streptomyces malaysiensis subsp. malaysiensis]